MYNFCVLQKLTKQNFKKKILDWKNTRKLQFIKEIPRLRVNVNYASCLLFNTAFGKRKTQVESFVSITDDSLLKCDRKCLR